jgi:hypothetical protein
VGGDRLHEEKPDREAAARRDELPAFGRHQRRADAEASTFMAAERLPESDNRYSKRVFEAAMGR